LALLTVRLTCCLYQIEITSDQGFGQLWRGNNSNLYKTWMQMLLRIFLYDKVKLSFMPYDTHKYKGFDYYFRAAGAFSICTLFTTLFVYPFDLVHTRISADMTQKG
jgi:hypothetical protein